METSTLTLTHTQPRAHPHPTSAPSPSVTTIITLTLPQVRSEPDWPVYRSAQLRFLPALHWIRLRMSASQIDNPRTHRYFGAAK